MNIDSSESFERNDGSDLLPELEYSAPMRSDNEDPNDIDYNFAGEDCPPVLEDFHENNTRAISFNASAEEEGRKRNCETSVDSREIFNDYFSQTESNQFTEKSRSSFSKESIVAGNSLRSDIETFNDNCSFVELGDTAVAGRDKGGMSNRFQMLDTDDCFDNNDSEKDDDNTDDDDLTKKLLSIQVLPRIPKLKRTETSAGGAPSESSLPHRSVLERAEVTTKSSSYPKWPKSNGGQTDDKHRWHSDHTNKDTNRGSRNRKEVESKTNVSRNYPNNRSFGANFRRPVDFERPKASFSKRLPCELLFDAIVAKENSQTSSSCRREGNELISGDSDTDNDSADTDIDADCKDNQSRNSKDKQILKSNRKDFHSWNSFKGEHFKHKERKFQKSESATSLTWKKDSELKSREDNTSNRDKSSHFSDKHILPNASQNPNSPVTGNSLHQNGSLSDVKLQNISTEHANPCSADAVQIFSHESVPLPATFKSEDGQFKRPSSGRAPRSKALERTFEQTSARSRQPVNFEAELKNRSESDGSERFKSSAGCQNDSPSTKSTFSPNEMDSVMEVVDMDVVASPLCDDKLLSSEPSGTAVSGVYSAARKVVTFDCPEDTVSSHKNGSKKQKASKREKGAQTQQASFETKCDIQKQVVSEMKELLRPLYSKRKISKEEYKEIMRQAVPKLCHNRTTRVVSSQIKKYADKYTSRVLKTRKQPSSDAGKQKTVSVAPSLA